MGDQMVRIERERRRPGRYVVDVVVLTVVFMVIAAAAVVCFAAGFVEVGVAVAMGLLVYLWRVLEYDASRVTDVTVREYARVVEPAVVKRQAVTYERRNGGVRIKIGQVQGTAEEYGKLLEAIRAHPRERLTVRAIPNGLLPDKHGNYGEFVREVRRLGWIGEDNELTDRGYVALRELAAGSSPAGDEWGE